MAGSYFVVDHVSDENKTDGLVESYQMLPVQYQQEDGTVVSGFRRVNFVHWPNVPTPFVHEEWSEDLTFTNIYSPDDDAVDEDEDEDEDDYDDEDEDEASFDGESEEGYSEAEVEG
jgi:hypothetical protein